MKQILIDPITRLEGHGKIHLFVHDDGNLANAYFQVPELRGFEKFCVGRPVEEMARITTRICGVCPDAHHMAAAKAADAVYGVKIPQLPINCVRLSITDSMPGTIPRTFMHLEDRILSAGRMHRLPNEISSVLSPKSAWMLAKR